MSHPSAAPTAGPAGRTERRQRATPRARRLAAERSLDLSTVKGSGPSGTVSASDVPADDGAAPPGIPTGLEPVTRAGPRAAAARSMERSQREIPHFHVWDTVDLEPALARLERHNQDRPPADRVLPAAVLLAAVAAAARQVPEVNGWWVDGDLVTSDTVDLGTVISLRSGGLATPTIQHADQLTVDGLMVRLKELVERSRKGGLRASDMSTASLTVTNLGDRGAEVVHGMIQPPQVALVGFGRIAARPFVIEDRVVARRTVVVSLAADHRASDGRIGSRFLHLVRHHLAEPDRLPFDPSATDPNRTDPSKGSTA
jgi:pyruvate dehydrogenase E2 component (dihydrolipoamide acetyltransferase)